MLSRKQVAVAPYDSSCVLHERWFETREIGKILVKFYQILPNRVLVEFCSIEDPQDMFECREVARDACGDAPDAWRGFSWPVGVKRVPAVT